MKPNDFLVLGAIIIVPMILVAIGVIGHTLTMYPQ